MLDISTPLSDTFGSEIYLIGRRDKPAKFRPMADLYLETKGVLFSASPKPFNPFGL